MTNPKTKNRNYGGQRGQTFNAENEMKVSLTGGNGVESEIDGSAWGLPKTSIDKSIFHALWTYEVPGRIWILKEDGVEILPTASTRIVSEAGELLMTSGANSGEYACLQSRRHPRYQPNRGHLFSNTAFLTNPTAIGVRRFGLFTQDATCNPVDGVFFQLENGVLYACLTNEGVMTKKEEISTATLTEILGENFDLEKGNLFDIQFQWRGVGDYFFYVNLKLVHKIENLGALETVSMSNPGLPVSYTCSNTNGTEISLKSGCCDVTTEGGEEEGKTYTGVSNADDVAITSKTPPVAMLAVHSKLTHKTKINTRDSELLRLTISTDQDARFLVYTTRDPSAFTNLVLSDRYDDSVLQLMDNAGAATPFTFDTTKGDLTIRGTVALGVPFVLNRPGPNTEFIISPGDYIVVLGEKKSVNALMSSTLEFGEEI